MSNWWGSLPTAYNSVSGTAKFRVFPEDFIVDEKLSFTPDGDGENIFLRIEKRELNTEQVAKHLARFADVKLMDVGYAGLKDKNAVTRQWFSVRIPGKVELDWKFLNDDKIKILEVTRNRKKLRRGVISQNKFQITVREFDGDYAKLESIAQKIIAGGVPNYFGDQRFGHDAGNVAKACQIFTGEYKPKGKGERSILISAARSYIFNEILRKRIELNNWNNLLPGDVAIFDNNNSIFVVDEFDQTILTKLQEMDIHPAAALYGSGEFKTANDPYMIESAVVEDNMDLALGCKNNNLKLERRAMRLRVQDFTIEQLEPDAIRFAFALKSGAYATVVLREMLHLTKP